MGEGQACEAGLGPGVAQCDRQGQGGVYVEAAAGSGEQYVLGAAQALKEQRLEHAGMIAGTSRNLPGR